MKRCYGLGRYWKAGSGQWVEWVRLSFAVLCSGTAHAEVNDKIGSVGTMHGCGR
ncbi:hypothetical protein [Deinococcus sp.]|uniref:hypothetical protein n=1 Tax=Deinococcus sp. TaxID=47478 RepID=UPI0025D327F6|nr:hypothetical protein [Deinococcus sp.]